MPPTTDHESVLRRIEELAARAATQADVPPSLAPVLREIADLAGRRDADTAEPSDIPQTDNQSL